MEEKPTSELPASTTEDRYTAFEKWKYERVFYEETASHKSWLDHAESFYRSAKILIDGVANDQLNEDVEGIAGLFLFRHYLELSLKRIIVAGRWLTDSG